MYGWHIATNLNLLHSRCVDKIKCLRAELSCGYLTRIILASLSKGHFCCMIRAIILIWNKLKIYIMLQLKCVKKNAWSLFC